MWEVSRAVSETMLGKARAISYKWETHGPPPHHVSPRLVQLLLLPWDDVVLDAGFGVRRGLGDQ